MSGIKIMDRHFRDMHMNRICYLLALSLTFAGCMHKTVASKQLPYSDRELELYFSACCDSDKYDFGCDPPEWFVFERISKHELMRFLARASRDHSQSMGAEEINGNSEYQKMIESDMSSIFKSNHLYRGDEEDFLTEVYYVIFPSVETNIVERVSVACTNCVEYLEIQIDPPEINDYSINKGFIDDEMMQALPYWHDIWEQQNH